MDNNAKSCFHIDPMKEFAYWHDFRQGFQASNVQGELTKNNEYSCTFSEARARAKQMKDEADAAYRARTGRRPHYNDEAIYWEATVNLRPWHTKEDIEKVVKILEKRLGYRTVFWTRHRDEGHIATDDEMDELGLSSTDQRPFIENDHFHIAMFSLDENGNSLHRLNYGKPNLISQIQTEIAQALGMERGISKKITKRAHLTPRQYRQAMSLQEPLQAKLGDVKNELKDAKKQIKELEEALKSANKQARANLQKDGAKREDYATLEQENRKLKDELAAFKKASADVNVEDFEKTFKEKIEKLRNHPKIDVEVEKAIKANNLRSGILGGFDKNSIMTYVADAVAVKYAAQSVIKEAQVALKKATVKKEIDVYEQLKALRENKIAGALFGAAAKPDVDVDALKKENASLLQTFDFLQKQNKDLQTALEKATSLINQKNTGLEKPQKNQEVVKQLDDSFFRGQAALLSQLIRNKQLYIEPKGQHLVDSLDDYLKGGYSTDYFSGIKSGLLSHCPSITPKNDLDFK
jgi:hypothetical protein